jgi:Ser-tRNA(Ala) deacylase AlaX
MASTIFHPQGGGQPSDIGSICIADQPSGLKFDVLSVRMDAVVEGQVLHFGRFVPTHLDPVTSVSNSSSEFRVGGAVDQAIDADARLLYSRLHTAGHVLGAAVRHILKDEIAGFDELKASHFPESAGCEFQGLIQGAWKGPIQDKVDEYVKRAMPVEIEWWDEGDFRREGLERLIPEKALPDGEKWRVVRIVGAECYPCGGTHVEKTDLCGKTTVKKISRSKGTSRVSYSVI